MTQSRIDCREKIVDEYGFDANLGDFTSMWDLHYEHEKGLPFEEELENSIISSFSDQDKETRKEIYDIFIHYFEDAKKRRMFFSRSAKENYGYEVCKRAHPYQEVLFHSYDKKKAEDYAEALKHDLLNGESKAVPPDTSDEVPPPRVLVLHERHGELYFQVNTPDELKEKASKYINLKLERGEYYPPKDHSIDKTLGMTKDEIYSLPNGKIKEVALRELDRAEDYHKTSKQHNSAWEAAQRIKKGGRNLNDISEVFNFYVGDRHEGNWSIVSPE